MRCSDGAVGVLSDIVLEPLSRRVTHLVVRPHEPLAQARLVPYELVLTDRPSGELMLSCTVGEAHQLQSIRAVSSAMHESPPELSLIHI